MTGRIKIFVGTGRRASRVEKMPQYDGEVRAAIEALIKVR